MNGIISVLATRIFLLCHCGHATYILVHPTVDTLRFTNAMHAHQVTPYIRQCEPISFFASRMCKREHSFFFSTFNQLVRENLDARHDPASSMRLKISRFMHSAINIPLFIVVPSESNADEPIQSTHLFLDEINWDENYARVMCYSQIFLFRFVCLRNPDVC